MRTIFILLILASCTSSYKSKDQVETQVQTNLKYDLSNDKLVDLVSIDLNNDKILDTIYFLNQPINDPGLFRKIFISLTYYDTLSLVNNEAWDKINFSNTDNQSDLVYINTKENISHLLFCGFQYSCCARKLTVVGIKSNKIKSYFNKDFEVTEVKDISNDGLLEIIGRKYFIEYYQFDENSNSEIGTYSPYEVYSMFPDKVYISYNLTKQFNLENYIFAGFKYSDKIKICYPKDNRKPFLFDNNDQYRCNSDFLKIIHENMDSLTLVQVQHFLLTFDKKCLNNVEFSEWSSELLLKILSNNPSLLIQALQTDLNINKDLIYAKIESPLYDLNFNKIYAKFENIPENKIKFEIIDCIKKAENKIKY